jgi:hypothetical protein
MAVAVVSKVAHQPDITRRYKRIRVFLTLSGSYVAGANGFVVDFTQLTNPFLFPAAFPGSVPDDVEIISLPAGFSGQWNPGTTLANGQLEIFTAPGVELISEALPAALTAANAIELELQGHIGAF